MGKMWQPAQARGKRSGILPGLLVVLAIAGCSDKESEGTKDAPVDALVDGGSSDVGTTPNWQDPCPPDTTPTKAGWLPGPQQGYPVLGKSCAKPGWPTAAATAPLKFTDVTADYLPDEVIGVDPCLLWRDLNGDGELDMLWVEQPPGPGESRKLRLFYGNGKGGFENKDLPFDGTFHVASCTPFDYDGDGDVDVAFSGLKGILLMQNVGSGFADRTNLLPDTVLGDAWTVGALDFDRDGDLDLFGGSDKNSDGAPGTLLQPGGDGTVCKLADEKPYTKCTIEGPTGTDLRLLRNDGSEGFVDVTPKLAPTIGEAMSILAHDLDRDGWPDLFVGNDFGEHGWYRNAGDGTFSFHSVDIGMRPYAHLMGTAMADFDGDGWHDLIMGDLGADTLYRGQPGASFSNASSGFGIWSATEHLVTWSQAAADLNNDGWIDLVTAASLVATPATWLKALYYEPFDKAPGGGHLLWRNNGGGKLLPLTVPFPAAAEQVIDSTVVAVADMEGDGDLDVMLTFRPGGIQALRNDTVDPGHWLRVELIAVDSAPGGAGAWVQVWRDGHVQERQATAAPGFGVDGNWLLHFGLGGVKELDEVRVWWPSGRVSLLTKVAVDAVLTITEADAMTWQSPAADPDPLADVAKGDTFGDRPWSDPCSPLAPPEKVAKGATPPVGLPVLRNHCAKAGWPTPASGKPLDFAEFTAGSGVDLSARWQRCLLWRDLSGDDVPDLALVREPDEPGQPATLTVYPGYGDGTFDAARTVALPVDFVVHDCAALDFDNDGLIDIALAGTDGLRLLRAKGIGVFADRSDLVPEALTGNPIQTLQVLDYDRDGRLDLYLGRYGGFTIDCDTIKCSAGTAPYTNCSPGTGTKGQLDTLLRNTSAGFVDVTGPAKLGEPGIAATATVHDLDRDGWPDLFVGNALTADAWFRNLGNGSFARLPAASLGLVGGPTTMGSAVADLNGDGRADLLTSAIGAASLYGGQVDGSFSNPSKDVAAASQHGLGSGVLLRDFDNDGWLDAVLSQPMVAKAGQLVANLNCTASALDPAGGHLLLHNDGVGGFVVAPLPLAATNNHSLAGAALAALDADGDQDPDLAIIDGDGVLRLLRNDSVSAGKALRVYLDAAISPPQGEGALVQVWVKGHVQERWHHGTTGHGANVPARLHFGLGPVDAVDEVRVWWPSGRISVVPGAEVALNQSLVVHEADTEHTYSWGPAAPIIGSADATDASGEDEQEEPEDVVEPSGSLIKPTDLTKLPTAAWVEITATFGLPTLIGGIDKPTWAFCTVGADLTGDGSEDFLLIRMDSVNHKVTAVLRDGGEIKIVESDIDATLFEPNLGCSAADMNADGLLDLLVGGHADGVRYLENAGGGKFVDKSAALLPFDTEFDGFSITPGDYDRDGDLDLFIGAGRVLGGGCNEITCGYAAYDYACTYNVKAPVGLILQDRMWLNTGKWPLQDATAAFALQPGGEGTQGSLIDIDRDGKVDLLVAEDFGGHRILHNTGKASAAAMFDVQGAGKNGFVPYAHAMGNGIGDFDGDGLWDLVITDLGPHLLYFQKKKNPTDQVAAKFEERALLWGLAAPTHDVAGWSPVVTDLNHDGLDDIYLATSAIGPQGKLTALGCGSSDPTLPPQHDLIFLNQGTTFNAMRGPPVKNPEGLGFAHVAQAAVDLDGDGDLDIVQVRTEGRLRILRNDMPKLGGYVDVRLVGKGGNTGAIGAIVEAKLGSKTMLRHIGATSFGGTAWHRVHFGLGNAKAIDEIIVHWPTGTQVSVVKNVAAGTTQVIKQP